MSGPGACPICERKIQPGELTEYRAFPADERAVLVHIACSVAERRGDQSPPL